MGQGIRPPLKTVDVRRGAQRGEGARFQLKVRVTDCRYVTHGYVTPEPSRGDAWPCALSPKKRLSVLTWCGCLPGFSLSTRVLHTHVDIYTNSIFLGLGWPWLGEFDGFIIIFTCFLT